MSAPAGSPQSRARAAFEAAFGAPPERIARAPGRVNIIGEHTDYNAGFVLPLALGVHTAVAASARTDGRVRVVAADLEDGRDDFRAGPKIEHAPAPWADYVRGMVWALGAAGVATAGADLAIAGDVPQGAGLSSSASLELAVGRALRSLAGSDASDLDLALAGQRAESDFVGTRCGIMDQLAAAQGARREALMIDCRSLGTQAIPIPDGIAVLIVHSGVRRGLVEGAYNARRAQCEAAAQTLGVPALRDVSLEDLERAAGALDPTALRRARHVVGENARVLEAAQALRAGDLVHLGRLMAASHASMRDDFEITTPKVDELVALLQGSIGEAGGARMTGGGFGGAVVALLAQSESERVLAAVARDYRSPSGEILTLEESAPASILRRL